jgi:hypothetical protein
MNLIGNKDKDMNYITSLVLLLVASTGMAQTVPNSFSSGTPALASEVNANFSDLDTRVNSASAAAAQAITDITVMESAPVTGEGFAQASCPAGMTAISANCACIGDGITSNFGMLAACASGDDGTGVQVAVAACDIDFTFDPALPFPETGVSATCVGLVTASSAAAMQSAKEILAAKVEYQTSMGKPPSVVQLRQAAISKHK